MATQDFHDGDARMIAARRDLAEAIDGAEPHAANARASDPDGLAKVDDAGLSFELRLNGETIPLDGKDVNDLSRAEFRTFLERQRLAVEAGEMDDTIRSALSKDGPGKALARVRAIGANGENG